MMGSPMNKVDEIYREQPAPASFAAAYLRYIGEVAAKMDPTAIAAMIELLLAARDAGRTIFFLGNGGSAATASHFANDIAIGTRSWDKPFRALSLTDNNAVMTAIANDDGYDKMFVQQLLVLMQPGDVVVGISASGNSPNVVNAIRLANERGNPTIGLTGFDGGQLRELAGISIHVPCAKGEYGPVEDLHMIVDHLVGGFLARAVRSAAS